MNEFVDKILQTLKTNGFPNKRVSLPTEKMYEAADNRGLSFNAVMDQLKATHSVDAKVGPDRIIFSKFQESQKSQEDLIKEAQNMMSQMDPEELRKIQEMFTNMSSEEKEEIMRKGKDMGLI
jgi:hypothetical protein